MKKFNITLLSPWIAAIILILVAVILVSCADNPHESSVSLNAGGPGITYYYDSAHEVGIWMYQTGYGCSIAVLPSNEISNPAGAIK